MTSTGPQAHDEAMKTFKQQRYPVTLRVRVYYPRHDFTDYIKGLNPGHALYLARLNWPGALVLTNKGAQQ